MPKALKLVPTIANWEDALYLMEPENWSPNAMYQATRIFASNMGVKKAERFYKLVLLPRVREDIRKNKRLHFALYQSLKKCLYKPAAFFKGFLFPLCEVWNSQPWCLAGYLISIKQSFCSLECMWVISDVNPVYWTVENMQSKGSCYSWEHLTKGFNSSSSFEVCFMHYWQL